MNDIHAQCAPAHTRTAARLPLNGESRLLLDALFEPVIIADAAHCVAYWNQAAAALYGWNADEVAGRPLADVFQYSSFVERRRREEIASSLQHHGYWEGEINQPDREGNLLFAQVRVCTTSSGEDGGGEGLLVIVRDTTRHRADERLLSEYQLKIDENIALLEKVNRRKDEFVATTSHELRTPLNGIVGFLTLVEQGLARDEEEKKKFIAQALASSKHLLTLINDLLDISKIESGTLTLKTEPVKVSEVWKEVGTILDVQARHKNIALTYRAPSRPEAAVMADGARLMQVLLNLVSNAIKFTNEGGVTVTVEERTDKGYVEFLIVDTGIGVARNMQHKLFKMFSQVDGSYTRRAGGTGLGLSIAKNLVEKMGGVIALESEGLGKGTLVRFRLPVAVQAAEPPSPAASAPDVARSALATGDAKHGVLIVEDDLMYAALIRDVLEDAGHYRVRAVRTAEDALSEVLAFRPSIVLSDYALPSRAGAELLNGIDLLKKIRSIPAVARTPVVMMSGHEDVCREIEYVEGDRALTRTLIKPLDIKELLSAVTSLVALP